MASKPPVFPSWDEMPEDARREIAEFFGTEEARQAISEFLAKLPFPDEPPTGSDPDAHP
jgi:hypothetical protein